MLDRRGSAITCINKNFYCYGVRIPSLLVYDNTSRVKEALRIKKGWKGSGRQESSRRNKERRRRPVAVTVLLFSRNAQLAFLLLRAPSLPVVYELGENRRGNRRRILLWGGGKKNKKRKKILSLWYPPRLFLFFSFSFSFSLSFQGVNKTMYAFRWVFLWGCGVITGSRGWF